MAFNFFFLILFLVSFIPNGNAQCELKSEMNQNGTISTTSQSELIYSNEKYQMYSQIKFDGIDYYLVWIVKPFLSKTLKPSKMEVLLDNKSTLLLDFYDSYETKKDTSMNFLYRVNTENVLLFSQNNIHTISFDAEFGVKNFILKLHKDQIKIQFNCVLNSLKKE